MKTPAVTMVAAWISAETGVGPSIASGSQMCRKNCADLAHRADEQQRRDHFDRRRLNGADAEHQVRIGGGGGEHFVVAGSSRTP